MIAFHFSGAFADNLKSLTPLNLTVCFSFDAYHSYFVAYEQLKARGLKLMEQRTSSQSPSSNSNFPVYLVSSATAGAFAGAVSNVMDVVKTRLQVAGGSQGVSMVAIAKEMYKNEGGLVAFTRGMMARVLWVIPSVTISMTIFEVLKERREQQKALLKEGLN
jgi:hypothetical protein